MMLTLNIDYYFFLNECLNVSLNPDYNFCSKYDQIFLWAKKYPQILLWIKQHSKMSKKLFNGEEPWSSEAVLKLGVATLFRVARLFLRVAKI